MDVVEFKVIIDPDDKITKAMFENDKLSEEMLKYIEKLSEFKWSSKNLYRAFIKFVMQFKVKREPFKFHNYLVKFFSDTDSSLIKHISPTLIQKYQNNDKVMSYNPFNHNPYGSQYNPVKSLFFLNMNN
jgi:hypothetical protein